MPAACFQGLGLIFKVSPQTFAACTADSTPARLPDCWDSQDSLLSLLILPQSSTLNPQQSSLPASLSIAPLLPSILPSRPSRSSCCPVFPAVGWLFFSPSSHFRPFWEFDSPFFLTLVDFLFSFVLRQGHSCQVRSRLASSSTP